MSNSATGPGELTEDGCAVELYRRLTAFEEPQIVRAEVAVGSTILELGAGAGRVTQPLLADGYRVTAVDASAAMVAHIRGTETIVAQIETLVLERTFDAILLGSNLINTPDDRQRRALLDACRRHVAHDGLVLIERYVPSRIENLKEGLLEERDGIRCFLRDLRRRPSEFSATLVHEARDATWTQSFSAKILAEDSLKAHLREAGLSFARWLDDRKSWLKAIPISHNRPFAMFRG